MFASVQFFGSDVVSMESALLVDLTKMSLGDSWITNQCFEITFTADYANNQYSPFILGEPTCQPSSGFTMKCNIKDG